MNGNRAEMLRLASQGRDALDAEAMGRLREFAGLRTTAGGAFVDRAGTPDLYYTMFGLWCLHALGGVPKEFSRQFVDAVGSGEQLDFVHLASLAQCRAILAEDGQADKTLAAVLERMERWRLACGGYALTREGGRPSSYAAFVGVLAYEAAGRTAPDGAKLLASLETLRCADGGWSNMDAGTQGITAATAAAVAVSCDLGANADRRATEWLMARLAPRGGFFASAAAPLPDLLSTATALFALRRADVDVASIGSACIGYVEGLWQDDGGFCGSEGDGATDLEYTFYALLTLGCLTDGR